MWEKNLFFLCSFIIIVSFTFLFYSWLFPFSFATLVKRTSSIMRNLFWLICPEVCLPNYVVGKFFFSPMNALTLFESRNYFKFYFSFLNIHGWYISAFSYLNNVTCESIYMATQPFCCSNHSTCRYRRYFLSLIM